MPPRHHLGLSLLFGFSCARAFCSALEEFPRSVEYGVDVSYPMHHASVSVNYDYLPHNLRNDSAREASKTPEEYRDMVVQPLGNRHEFHQQYLEGCRQQYGENNRCDIHEQQRIEMSLRQPKGMRNYTEMGFTKIRAPDHVFKLIQEFWELNKEDLKVEQWGKGDIYTNHWEAPAQFVSVEDPSTDGGGDVLKNLIWNAARDTIQEWTGQRVVECSLYGIRVYPTNAVLATHVDRLPLVSSAIINVDQDVDEPWPLEVIGHDGKAHNVTMEPGDLVLYESHSVLHGRPFPLKGRFYANVFIHFEPIGPLGGHTEFNGDLPPYVIPGSEAETHWRREHPQGHKLVNGNAFEAGSNEAHHFAQLGKYEELKRVVQENPSLIHARDRNGWMPLHEAVRGGNTKCVQLLLDYGADVNARTGRNEEGGSPMWYVEDYHEDDDILCEELLALLRKYDGVLHKPFHTHAQSSGHDEL